MTKRDAGYLLDVPIDRLSLEDAVNDAVRCIDRRDSRVIFVCANPHSIVAAQEDRQFSAALNNSDFSVADGVGVTMMAKMVNIRIGPRIAGHDYFKGILDALQKRGNGRVFFFGSSDHVLDLIGKRFRKEYPGLTLCGALSPPYGEWSEEDNESMIRMINAAEPDVLWVGMTAPKQEKWVEANKGRLNASVIGSIGAVFDFYAGTYPRAPVWMCKLGMEWVYRLVKEPRRMWRRNFISSPKFVYLMIKRHIFGRLQSKEIG